jgi:hypothetical protein
MLRTLALAAGAASAAVATGLTPGAWPLEGTVDLATQFTQALAPSSFRPTGFTKKDYLPVVNGIAQVMRSFQLDNGTVIDPYAGVEIQYATPCTGHAMALVYAQGLDATVLPNASAAVTSSVTELAQHRCADGHCNFFTKPVMLAYRTIASIVSEDQVSAWNASLLAMNPAVDYINLAENWGLVATVGDYMRTTLYGLGNTSWWQGELASQLSSNLYTSNGLYQDHSGSNGLNPLPYDTFPTSGYVTVLLREGYNGTFEPFLSEITRRAAWSHMLMQSPRGEIPTGGRSSQHQWNEAVSALAYEIFAAKYNAEGDAAAACMFKRAAHKSLESVKRWQNPSGDVQIVKNHFDPSLRFGYEVYSFLTNYNALPSSMLAAAFEYADESIPECPTFSDVGGFVFQLPEHELIIASAGGTYVEIETAADPHYDSSGLHRIHFDTCGMTPAGQPCVSIYSLLGPTAGPPQENGGIGVGPWWVLSTDLPGTPVRSLGNMTYQDITAVVLTPGPIPNASYVTFQVEYILLAQGTLVTQQYTIVGAPLAPSVTVTSGVTLPGAAALVTYLREKKAAEASTGVKVHLNATKIDAAIQRALAEGFFAPLPANVSTFGVELPLFLFDGQTNMTVNISAAAGVASVAGPAGSGMGSISYAVTEAGSTAPVPVSYDPTFTVQSRNGIMGKATASLVAKTLTPALTITVTPQADN